MKNGSDDHSWFDSDPILGPIMRKLGAVEPRLVGGLVLALALPLLVGAMLNFLAPHPTTAARPGCWIGLGAAGAIVAVVALSLASLRRRGQCLDAFEWLVALCFLIMAVGLAAYMLGWLVGIEARGALRAMLTLLVVLGWWRTYRLARRDNRPVESAAWGVLFSIGVIVVMAGDFLRALGSARPDFELWPALFYGGFILLIPPAAWARKSAMGGAQ
jgi:hypothetical protein